MEHSGLWTPDPTDQTSSPVSLSSVHISQAKQASTDDFLTLSFAKLNLTEIGATAVEELLSVGKASSVDAPQRITLGYNRLARLPSEFVLLSHLRYLNLERNNFTVFPDVLISMPALDILDISHNKIRRLPQEAGQLSRLRVLCLRRNKLARLPAYLRDFHSLEILQIERNPLEWPPSRVIQSFSRSQLQESRGVDVHALQLWMETNPREALPDLSGYSNPSSNDLSDKEWQSQLSSSTENSFDRWPHSRTFSVESSLSMTSIAERLEDEAHSDDSQPNHRFQKLLTEDREVFTADKPPWMRGAGTKGNLRITTQTTSDEHQPPDPQLPVKRSMPDLRTAKLNFTKKSQRSINLHPLSYQEGSSTHETSNSTIMSDSESEAEIGRHTFNSSDPKARDPNSFSVAGEKIIPLKNFHSSSHPLSCLAEFSRSLVFAVSRIQHSFRQNILTVDETTSTVRKIMDPVEHDIAQLSHALDGFESIRRRTLPPPAVCRTLVESCKEVVTGFWHAIDLLHPILLASLTRVAKQVARWMIVDLWAATAEIADAWQRFLPLLHSISPWLPGKLTPHPFPQVKTSLDTATTTQTSLQAGGRTHNSALASPAPLLGAGARSRRHAGSFSYKDVELGKLLPSNEEFPSFLRGIAQGAAAETPTLRAPKRHMTIPLTTVQSPSPTAPDRAVSSTSYTPWLNNSEGHSRHSSQTPLFLASHSPSLSLRSFLAFTTATDLDPTQEVIQAVLAAVNLAPPVWDLFDSMPENGIVIEHTTQALTQTARDATSELANAVNESIINVYDLRLAANAFLKTVVQVSNTVKSLGRLHDFSPTFREKMLELMNATEHLANLLQVTMDVPTGSQSRSISPVHPLIPSDPFRTPSFDGLHLSSSLSRGRSTSAVTGPYLSPTSSIPVHPLQRINSRETYTLDRNSSRNHEDPG